MGEKERIEKGSRERIDIERKETKGTEFRICTTLASACCSASSRH